jgi:hypothetical protein
MQSPSRTFDTKNHFSEGVFELRFQPLAVASRAMAFPCDAEGHVELDSLSNRARNNYYYARSLIGREFLYPIVRSVQLQ